MNDPGTKQIQPERNLNPFKIAAVYAIAGGLWIFFSDRILASIIEDPQLLTRFQSYKGWVFVLATALLLYWLIGRYASEIKQSKDAIKESEQRFRQIAETIHGVFWMTDADKNRMIYISPCYEAIWGRTCESLYAEPRSWLDTIHPDDRRRVLDAALTKQTTGGYDEEYRIIRPDGSLRWIRDRAFPVSDDSGKVYRIAGIAEDITGRKKAEQKILHLNRLYATLSKTSDAILRIRDLKELYSEACRIAVEECNLKMAWIGLVDMETHLVRPFAYYGCEDSYLDNISISIDPDVPEGKGPTGTAIRERKYFVCNDIVNDPRMLQWREEALIRGYRSSSAFPLWIRNRPVGSINLYAPERDFFHEEGVKLLKTLANNISFAMELIEIEKERLEAEEELKKHRDHLEELVKERTSELQENQQALINIVEDLNQKTEELEQANIRLKEVDRLKSMFIASMSHELRTPLNSVIGFSSVLFNEWAGHLSEEQKGLLSKIYRSGKHLLSLINDVIDVSKIEAGMIDVHLEEFDLHDLIIETVDLMKKDIADKHLELKVDAIHLAMHTDRRRLFQSILNLLSNAVKFTMEGTITVSTALQSGFIEISVEDTGIGIKEEDMPRLFGSFVRLDSPLRATVPGTGIGLYLTKKLVTELLKGAIFVESRYGEGSKFTLKMPARI